MLETNRLRKNCLKKFVEENGLASRLTIVEKLLGEVEISDLNNSKVIDAFDFYYYLKKVFSCAITTNFGLFKIKISQR